MIKTCSAMPRFYPNIQFSDCWSSVGDITYYHRNGICYFRSKAYTEFKGTSEQMVRLDLHRRAIRAWQGLDHATQMVWRSLSKNVVAHRPPFDNRNHISGYNLFVSAYHGFAQLGHEHVPEPQAFVPFPIFNLDFGGSGAVGDSDIMLQTRLTLYGTEEYSRYRVLGKIQFETPGYGRNPGKMRNFLSVSVPTGSVSDIVFLIQDYRSIWGLDLEAYQLHMRYILLDTVTGYRSQYHSLSTLVMVK